ncbi:MAG: hypothetical protein AAGJ18_04705 [Bacteroidota bacterium]
MNKGLLSDLFIVAYLGGTLLLRFYLEASLQGAYMVSILVGGFGLLFLWAMIKGGLLEPNYFGLIEKKTTRASQRRAMKKAHRKSISLSTTTKHA